MGDSKLFASGGGNASETALLDRAFVRSLAGNSILYIPVGLVRDFVGYEGCYEWLSSTLAAHASTPLNITMWVNLSKKAEESLESYDAIYIGGASNTYWLLEQLEKTDLKNRLTHYVLGGGTLYGGSAGAVLMGKSIGVVQAENKRSYPSDVGLGLVGNYSIYCHYGDAGAPLIEAYIERYKNPVIALGERSGIAISGGSATVVGYDAITIIDVKKGVRVYQPNEIFPVP